MRWCHLIYSEGHPRVSMAGFTFTTANITSAPVYWKEVFTLLPKKLIALALVLGLLLSLQPATAADTDKIHPLVADKLNGQDFVQVLIKLSQQQDPQAAAQAALNKLPIQATPSERKHEVGQSVYSTLQATAAASQQPLLDILETAAQEGLARNVRGFYIVNIIYVEIHPSLIPTLARRGDVAAVLPNSRISQEDVDPSPTQTTLAPNPWNLRLINAPTLHQAGLEGEGIVVGIIDTGVDWNHPDIKTSWRGYEEDGSNSPSLNWFDAVGGEEMPYDDDGHGTHVAGIIAGKNGLGVAPGAKWMAAKAFDEFGDANSAWLLSAGEYMLAPLDASGNPRPDMAPDLINNSWGREPGLDEWYRPMVQAWRAAGILPVFAAGNETGVGTIYNPANYPESLSVGAVDWDSQRSSFSAQGPAPYPELFKPDLAAPGENITSTKAGGGYGTMSGTSVAAPHVTGIAALLLSQDSSLTPDILEAVLKQTALPLTDSQFPDSPNSGYGYGLVKADAAMALVQNGMGIIRGQVNTMVSGASAPVIEHSPVHDYYTGASLPIYARIDDELGIAKAEVTIWDSVGGGYLTYPMSLVDGDNLSGAWMCWLPFDVITPPSLEYSIHTLNRAGLESISGPHLVRLTPGTTPPYTTDFSQFPLGWIWDGDWEWGKGSSSPQPQHGQALFGTKLEDNYMPDSWSSLYAPPLDLREVTGATVTFQHWFDLAPGDSAQIFISADDLESWEVLATYEGSSSGWQSSALDLSAWDNWATPLVLGFDLMAEEDGGGKPGWFIDQFLLEGTGPSGQVQSMPAGRTLTAEGTGTLPLEAVLTVLETGETVRTGYSDGVFAGSFLLLHSTLASTETLTLRVEARGYRPLETDFSITAGETVEFDLTLEPLVFSFQRLSGSNRFATAAAVSQDGWASAETIFLARGDDYADALAGVPLAAAINAPVLLTHSNSLPEETRQELTRLKTSNVYILGGDGAISPEVEAILTQEMGIETERISGANRFATAAEIARRLAKLTSFDAAIIAYGNNFPDALAAAPFAAAQAMPILLTQTNRLPEDTILALEELGIERTIVAGGTGAISDQVLNSLPQPLRLEGRTRYETAVALAEYFQPRSDRLYLATGRDFADAISGAVLAARDNAALLLVGDNVPLPVTEFIMEYGTEEIRLLGGTAVLPESVPQAIQFLEAQ